MIAASASTAVAVDAARVGFGDDEVVARAEASRFSSAAEMRSSA